MRSLRKTERTKLLLIDGVRAEVLRTGQFTADGVARHTGTSPATFYNHFANKDDALVAAYASLMQELSMSIADRFRIDRLLDEGLEGFVHSWLTDSGAFFAAQAPLFRLAQARIDGSKALRDLFRLHENSIRCTYQRLIELGQRAQVIRHGQAEAMAQLLTVLSEGWFHPQVQRMTRDSALHREMTACLVHVLAPKPATVPTTDPTGPVEPED